MNKVKVLLAGSVLAASTVASSVALAESPLTGNIGFTSNYIWRGVTQAADESAISGGIDFSHDSGLYIGTWVSSLGGANQFEHDLYLGYSFDAGPVGLDIGYITYRYPIGTVQADFDEVYVNASYQMVTAGLAYTVDTEANAENENDMYMYVSAGFEVRDGLMLGVTYGDYGYDDPAATDYSHWQLSLAKDDFVFAVDQNDLDGDDGDTRFTVSYSKSFDL